MLPSMTRMTITLDDRLAAAVRAAAGDNVSAWMARLARGAVAREAAEAELAHDRGDPDWQARVSEHARETDNAA